MRIQAAPAKHYAYLVEKTGCTLTSDFRAIEATDASGKIHGMVGYANWTPNSVQAHMAVEAPLVWRSLLLPAFAFPFLEADRQIILGVINSNNKRSLRMVQSLGFCETHRVRDGHMAGVDLVFFEMRRDLCPWIQKERKVA